MTQGYIKLYRKIQDNEFWIREKFDKQRAWIDLLLMAQHKDKMFSIRDNDLLVKRGQIAIADRTLAKRWKWSRDKVRRFIIALEVAQQIRPQKSNLITVYSIVNYNAYQKNDTTNKTTDNTTDNTINKNVKNDNNKDMFKIFWEAYPKKVSQKKAKELFAKKATNGNFELIMAGLERYKKSESWAKGYIHDPTTWLNQERWNDEIILKPTVRDETLWEIKK